MAAVTVATSAAGTAALNPYEADLAGWLGGPDGRRETEKTAAEVIGTGKSHMLIALGVAAVQAGHRVRYFTAAELAETLYRALADNSVGKTIENLLRNDLIICDELGFAPP